ncbi:unnamed protein product [Schistocephalus solidus]|uniref:Hexosyltransferase n=1 Tax=Schistocephalus solidus TaxID=70667 RepID=A0A183TSF0_SCHSO|nr:unnamed protein product [Schistocephalus solidus]
MVRTPMSSLFALRRPRIHVECHPGFFHIGVLFLAILAVIGLYALGVVDVLLAAPFQEAEFLYRCSNGPITFQREMSSLAQTRSSFHPHFRYLHKPSAVCAHASHNRMEKLQAVVLIKSAVDHREHRNIIRTTWMSEVCFRIFLFFIFFLYFSKYLHIPTDNDRLHEVNHHSASTRWSCTYSQMRSSKFNSNTAEDLSYPDQQSRG